MCSSPWLQGFSPGADNPREAGCCVGCTSWGLLQGFAAHFPCWKGMGSSQAPAGLLGMQSVRWPSWGMERHVPCAADVHNRWGFSIKCSPSIAALLTRTQEQIMPTVPGTLRLPQPPKWLWVLLLFYTKESQIKKK